MRLYAVIGLSFLLAGCVTGKSSGYYTQSADGWRGRNLSELTAAWGEPNTVLKGFGGKTTYIYRKVTATANTETYSPSIGIDRETGATVVANPSVTDPLHQELKAYCNAAFTANAAGKIVGVTKEGNCKQ